MFFLMETIFVLSWNVSFDVSWVILICCFCFDRFFCLWKNLCFCFRDFFWQIWQNVVDVFFAFEVGDRDRDVVELEGFFFNDALVRAPLL